MRRRRPCWPRRRRRGAVPGQPGLAQCGRGGRARAGGLPAGSRRRGCGPTPTPSWSSESAAPTRRPGRRQGPAAGGGPRHSVGGQHHLRLRDGRTLRELDGYQSIYIDCIAKNFETLEPGLPSGCCASTWSGRYGAEGARAKAHLRHRARRAPPSTSSASTRAIRSSPFPETIGGRYSVGGDVGLFPMAVAGVDIRALVQGMRTWDTLLAAPAEREPAPALRLPAPIAVGARLPPGDALLFEPRLDYFAKWWIQLFAGEREAQGGHRPLPGGGLNSEDLHHRPVHPGGQSHPFRDLRGGARPRRVGAPAPRGQEGLFRLPDGQRT